MEVVPNNGYMYRMYANALIECKQPTAATTAYLQAWKWGGLNTPSKVSKLSTLLLNASRWHEAVDVVDPWRGRPDVTPELLNQLGVAQAQLGQDAAAEAAYRQCVERFPDYTYAHFGWAEFLQKRGAVEEAAAQDVAGLTRQPTNVPALERLAWNYTHSPDLQAHTNAEELARQAVRLTNGRDLDSLNLFAFTQAVNGQWEEAIATALQAQEIAEKIGGHSAEAIGCRARLECYRHRSLHYGEAPEALR